MNSIGPRKLRASIILKQLQTNELILHARDGVRLLAELDSHKPASNAIVILLHGWEGSSRSAYQVTTAKYLLDNGLDVLRINFRDHGESHHLNRGIFNSTMTDEVAEAIDSFLMDHSYDYIFMAGFSLGGSFCLRIAADHGSQLKICAAVAISPPIDPVNAMKKLNETFFIYRRYFYHRWTRSLKKKADLFSGYNFSKELSQADSLNELNDFFIPRFTPFQTPNAYFSAYAITGDRLGDLQTPSYLIAALDDPILPSSDVKHINRPKHLSIELHRHGGHCGFITNLKGTSWIESRLMEIFDHHR